MIRPLALFVVLLVACSPSPVPPVVPGQPGCEPACLALARLDCPEAKPSRAGASCVEICERLVASPTLGRIDTACVSGAESVDQVRTCAGVRCGATL